MPIMAKSNDEYTEVKAIKTPNGTEIDYVLSKVDNTYKRTYTAIRELEDAPPLEFKSIKPNANLIDYRIYGQTSRNLFDMKTFAETCFKYSATINYTNNTLTFTATGMDAYVNAALSTGVVVPLHYRSSCIDVLPSTTYTISMSSAPKCFISWVDSSFNVVSNFTAIPTNATSYTFTTPKNCTKLLFRLGKYVTNIGDTFTISDIMLNSGSTPLPYEPYGESVGDRTANLFDKNKITENKYVYNGSFNNSTVSDISEYISISNGLTYTLSWNVSRLSSSNPRQIGIYDNQKHYLGIIQYEVSGRFSTSFTVDIMDAAYIVVTIDKGFQNIMLNTGSEPLPYEPYGYKVPVTVSNGTDTLTTPIYLPEQIKKVGDEAEYIDYGEQKQYIETTDGQEKYVVGLNVDFENKTFTRLADAVGLSKGADFDNFSAFGGRRRCNVADNGTITAYYGDANYTEDGSNGQVMVYQPAFYYKVEPLKIEAQESGVGYHLRNANYYISNHQGTGFKLHPAFYNEAGDRVDYILLGAYEGCIYDTSANAYITDDSQVMDTSEDKLSSIANVKPASGLTQNLSRANTRKLAQNRGKGWEQMYAATMSASQMLMLVEYASFNMQSAIGAGVTNKTDDGSTNMAELTGTTINLGNASGVATNTNNFNLVSYRGEENLWGNIWQWVDGINEQNPRSLSTGARGTLYVAGHGFADETDAAPYEDTGIRPAYAAWTYISAFGYSESYDWLFIPTETIGNSSLPVGDIFANQNTGWRIPAFGGSWSLDAQAGAFTLTMNVDGSYHARSIGGRLVYIPQIEKQHIYTTDLDVTLPALPTLTGTNVLSVGTEVQPSDMYIKGNFKMIAGGGE